MISMMMMLATMVKKNHDGVPDQGTDISGDQVSGTENEQPDGKDNDTQQRLRPRSRVWEMTVRKTWGRRTMGLVSILSPQKSPESSE